MLLKLRNGSISAEGTEGRAFLEDLEIESPYNTYKYSGLPPGPIASPGLKSIEAALYPEDVEYLYFRAKNDGSHIFTKTYDEHRKAENKINN